MSLFYHPKEKFVLIRSKKSVVHSLIMSKHICWKIHHLFSKSLRWLRPWLTIGLSTQKRAETSLSADKVLVHKVRLCCKAFSNRHSHLWDRGLANVRKKNVYCFFDCSYLLINENCSDGSNVKSTCWIHRKQGFHSQNLYCFSQLSVTTVWGDLSSLQIFIGTRHTVVHWHTRKQTTNRYNIK